jgi:hypothetical protein
MREHEGALLTHRLAMQQRRRLVGSGLLGPGPSMQPGEGLLLGRLDEGAAGW